MGKGEIGGMPDEHRVGVQKSKDIAVKASVGKDDDLDEVVVEEADRQWLDVDDTIKPNKMEVGPLRENDFPAENFLMMKGTDVTFTAC